MQQMPSKKVMFVNIQKYRKSKNDKNSFLEN